MDLGRIYTLQQAMLEEELSMENIVEVQSAFDHLVASGVQLRDLAENATIGDQLDELQEHVTPVEEVIYKWVADNFGETEANDPSWSTFALAAEINKMQVILGADNGTIGHLVR